MDIVLVRIALWITVFKKVMRIKYYEYFKS